MNRTAQYFGVVVFAMILNAHSANAGVIDGTTDGTSNTLTVGVTYTAGAVVQGPLSYGLLSLPTEVAATFGVGAGFFGNFGTEYILADVTDAQVAFGDGLWTDLTSFNMTIQYGTVTALSYQFAPINTLTTNPGGIVLNFPLEITGTDTVSGDAFKYVYVASAHEISEASSVPEPNLLSLLGLCFFGLVAARFRFLETPLLVTSSHLRMPT